MGFFRKSFQRLLSKYSFSPKSIFGRWVDSLDGGSYEYTSKQSSNSKETQTDFSKCGSVPFMVFFSIFISKNIIILKKDHKKYEVRPHGQRLHNA